MDSNLSLLGVIALELRPQTQAARLHLGQAQAGEWAALIAQDVARLLPGADELDFAVLAAHYDPVELLRPQWPKHAELQRLLTQAPRRGLSSRVLAFGSDDALPDAWQADGSLAQGHFRVVPFILQGDASQIKPVGDAMETRLLETGMIHAAAALYAQQAFGCDIEHARLMSLHDCLAMTAVQYDHAGLSALWPVIETALLRSEQTAWLDQKPEPLICYRDREAHIALMDHDVWFANGFALDVKDAEKAERFFQHYEARVRQIAALLEAHGIPVMHEHVAQGKDPMQVLLA
jgi:hypothetical protein